MSLELPDIKKRNSFESKEFSNLEFIPSVVSKGRPKGGRGAPRFKNTRLPPSKKQKTCKETAEKQKTCDETAQNAPKKHGRPPGSKNKSKDENSKMKKSASRAGRPAMKGYKQMISVLCVDSPVTTS